MQSARVIAAKEEMRAINRSPVARYDWRDALSLY
jgi:hypothetical protein